MHHTKTILLASLLLFPLSALAQTEVPNAFSDGTPALAAEVNENFTAVADGVNAQDVRIQSVENAIAGPEKMVFLGYAAGVNITQIYFANKICKDAYSNPAARLVTLAAWLTFINEGQPPLPSQSASILNPSDAIPSDYDQIGYCYSPSINQRYPCTSNFKIMETGYITRIGDSELVACMAPAG